MAHCIEVFDINVISGPARRLLHLPQGFYRADGDLDAENLGVDSGGLQLCVWRNALESLNNIQQAQFRLDCNPLSARQLCGNREGRAEESIALLDMIMSLDGDLGNPLEVLRIRRDDDVHVLRATDNSPRSKCETAD